nr:unnamed protein product [Spirometra erinaceieuropaei]
METITTTSIRFLLLLLLLLILLLFFLLLLTILSFLLLVLLLLLPILLLPLLLLQRPADLLATLTCDCAPPMTNPDAAPRNKFHEDNDDIAISNLLAEKNNLHKAYVDHPTHDNGAAICAVAASYNSKCARCGMPGQLERLSRSNEVCGPSSKGTSLLLSADGSTILTEKTQILQLWTERFRAVLNRPSTIFDAAASATVNEASPERTSPGRSSPAFSSTV